MKTKKELKEAYKQHTFQMGVFQLRNLTNSKVFIDCSTDVRSKWNRIKMELNYGTHKNRALLSDWKEFGEQNFAFEMLSELEKDDDKQLNYAKELQLLQKMLIEELNLPEEMRY